MGSLSKALNEAVLKRLAGDRTFQRGLDYYLDGRVESMDETEDGLRAMVAGSRDYQVTLASDEGILDYSCECPQGEDGAFCKHCVAAALAWLRRPAAARSKGGRQTAKLTVEDAAKFLREEDKNTLIAMILQWAKDDSRLQENLLIYAARRSGPEVAAAAAMRTFENAVRTGGYLHYREASDWAHKVDRAITNFEKLLADGHAGLVIDLCEKAVAQLCDAIEAVDDSGGHFAVLQERLEDIHFRACKAAKPDPVALARRLLRMELENQWDVFCGAVERYAGVLGDKGLAEYRRLAEAEWEKVPVQIPGNRHDTWIQHSRIEQIMESLARASGDVEELVSVLSRDLAHPYNFLRIAEAYREAGRHDDALLWAEKGLKAFPVRRDSRLVEFAAEEYHRRGRHADAMNLIWAQFCASPFLNEYRNLKAHAKKAGQWPQWRERALAEIRRGLAEAKATRSRRGGYGWGGELGHSVLVEIFLYEGDTDAAWREAQEGGCSQTLWLRLAEAREKDHPEDAAPIYWRQAAAIVAARTNGVYEDAVDLLEKTASLMQRMGRSEEFVRNLEALRADYKRKRNFIKLLDQRQGKLYLAET